MPRCPAVTTGQREAIIAHGLAAIVFGALAVFLTWPLAVDAFHEAVRRTVARAEASPTGRKQATTIAFLGAKGGSGVTTLAVNCGVEISRLSKQPTVILDLKPVLTPDR